MNIKLLGSLNQRCYKEFSTEKLNGKCSRTFLNSYLVKGTMGLGNVFICKFTDFSTKFENFHPKLEKLKFFLESGPRVGNPSNPNLKHLQQKFSV